MPDGVLAGEVQQWAGGRWRTILTPSGVPVDDRRRTPTAPATRPGPARAEPDDLLTELMARYARRQQPFGR